MTTQNYNFCATYTKIGCTFYVVQPIFQLNKVKPDLYAIFIHFHIETRTLLQPFMGLHHSIAIGVGTQIAVSAHSGNGKFLLQGTNQCTQGKLLFLGPCVGRMSLGIKASFVSNADAMLVVASGMGTSHLQRSGTPDESVFADVEMITDAGHPSGPMAAEQILLREIYIHPGSGAMHHYHRDGTCHPTHAVTPKAPAMAEATAMMIFKTTSHTFFFLSCSVCSLFIRFILQFLLCFLLLPSPVPAS